MTIAEHRTIATQLRTMLLAAYQCRGNDFGLGLARRCAWEIGDIVAEIHGRDRAGEVLDTVSNNVLQDSIPALVPRPQYEPPVGMMAITIPRTRAEADAMIAWIEALRDSTADGVSASKRVTKPDGVSQRAKPVVTKRSVKRRGVRARK